MSMIGVHHAYFGLIALIICWIVIFKMEGGKKRDRIVWTLGLFGLWMISDDLAQHWRQADDPHYHSPVHRIYVWVMSKLGIHHR